MPVSSVMDGNFPIGLPHDLVSMPNYSFTSVWLDSGIPAGMTEFLALSESFCCSVSRLKLVAKKSTKLFNAWPSCRSSPMGLKYVPYPCLSVKSVSSVCYFLTTDWVVTIIYWGMLHFPVDSLKLKRDGVFSPITYVLKTIEVFKRFGRDCKPWPALFYELNYLLLPCENDRCHYLHRVY